MDLYVVHDILSYQFDINIRNDFLMLVWMIGFDLFHDMVEWEVCKDNWICLKALGWTMFLTYLLNFTSIRFLYAINKGGKVLDNALQFGVYEKLKGVV